MHAKQEEIEAKYSRKNIRTHIMDDIDSDHDVFQQMVKLVTVYRSSNYYESKNKRIQQLTLTSQDIVCELLAAILPIKIVSPIQAVCAQVGIHIGFKELLDGVKTASELIAVCEEAGVYDIYHNTDAHNRTGTLGIKPNYSLDSATEAFIEQTKYLPPMLVQPRDWTNNHTGGYLNENDSVILGQLNHHEDEQSLDVINILQNISWAINEVVDFEELSKKALDTHDKQVQFENMTKESLQVYEDLMKLGNKFYFTWKVDKRGRMYSQGYHCNLQGTEYKKAILNFSKKELIV